MDKGLFTLVFSLLFAFHGVGQEIKFEANAPEKVAVGQQFRLTFTVNAQASDFKILDKINNFDIVYGPSTSSSYNRSVVGGKTETQISQSYVYILRANREGSFNVPKASVKVDGKTIESNSLKIEVTSDKEVPQEDNDDIENSDNAPSRSSSGNISDSDAFIRTIVSKTPVYEQESVEVTYKLFTKLNVNGIRNLSDSKFDGFDMEDVNVSNESLQPETYNGQKYYTAIIRKLLLTPQKKGDLIVPESTFKAFFQVPTGDRSFFGEEVRNVEKNLIAKSIKIKTISLPTNPPSDFANVVGDFSITSSISTTRTKIGKIVLIRIVYSGKGNTNRIPVSKLQLPKSFDTDRPQLSQEIHEENGELVGTKTIEYRFIPRETGDYKIPSVSVTYFDTESKTFKTLSTPEFNVKVGTNSTEKSTGIYV